MDRAEIDRTKSHMLQAQNDRPSDQSFAALSLRAEAALYKSIQEAREVVGAAARASGGFSKLTNEGGEQVPALADAIFLIEGMRQAKDMIFRDTNRVDIGIGGGRVNKVSKWLYCATEGYCAAQSAIAAVGAALQEQYAGFAEATYERAAKALITMSEWDQGTFGAMEFAPYAANVLRALESNGAVSFTLFVCPPVEFGYLRGGQPEEYLRTSLSNSLLSRQVADLRRLFPNLERSSVSTFLTVVVGDADETDYIWPVLGRPENLLEERLSPRRQELCTQIVKYLSEAVGKDSPSIPRVARAEQLRIVSLSETQTSSQSLAIYEQFVSDPAQFERFLRPLDFSDERIRLLELWGAGDYYDGLPQPNEQMLEQIIIRKFAAYSMQGVFLNELDPDTVLLQTERPPILRTRMLSSGRASLGVPEIPAIYQCPTQEDREGDA